MFKSVIIAKIMLLSLCAQASGQLTPKVVSQVPKTPLRDGKWEFLETKKNIRLSRKLVGKEGLFAVRGETVIASPVGKLLSVIHDESRWGEWTLIMSAKRLRLHPDNRKTVYQSFKMPMILSNRDVIYTFGVWELGETTLISGKTEPHSKGPETVGVRMHLVGGDWYLTPTKDGRTRVVLEVLMDPKGYLPVWFVNVVQRDYPVNTLLGLAKQAAKPDVKSFPRTSFTKLTPVQAR